MLACAESTDNTLSGAVDGTNRVFISTRPMRLDLVVSVYINGMLRVAEVANGYELTAANQITMREAPLPGEEVAVVYLADAPPVALSSQAMPQLAASVLGTEPPLSAHEVGAGPRALVANILGS